MTPTKTPNNNYTHSNTVKFWYGAKPKNLLIIIITLILLSLTTYAQTAEVQRYPNVGGLNYNYATGTGEQYNDNSEVTSFLTNNLGDIKGTPIVDDFDFDGDLEIAVQFGNSVSIIQPSNLSVIDTYAFNVTPSTNLQIYSFDIDGDGPRELFAGGANPDAIFILSFNGTDLFPVAFLQPGLLGSDAVACVDTNRCAAIAMSAGDVASPQFRMFSLNLTDFGSTASIYAGANGVLCLPHQKGVGVADYDSDGGLDEYMVSFVNGKSLGTETAHVRWIRHETDNTFTVEASYDQGVAAQAGTANCADTEDRYPNLVTPPMILEDPNGNVRSVVGFQNDPDEFQMQIFDGSGSVVDTSPDTFNADGKIVSNPALLRWESNSGESDVCMVGYNENQVGEEVDVLCHSFDNDLVDNDDEEFFYPSGLNLTAEWDLDKPYQQLHSIESQFQVEKGADMDELLTPFGILQFEYNFFGEEDGMSKVLDLEDFGAATWITVDFDKDGVQSLLGAGPNTLYIIGDVAFDTVPQITQYSTDATSCFTQGFQENTTITVQVSVEDQAGGIVGARIKPYFGTDNEFTVSNTVNVTAPDIFTLQFFANVSTASMVLRIEAFDTVGTGTDVVDAVLTILPTGTLTTSCKNEVTVVTPSLNESITAINAQRAAGDDAISNSANQIADLTGLGIGPLWYVVIALFIGLGFIYGVQGGTPVFGGVVGLTLGIIAMFLGVILGFIGIGLILILATLGIIGAGIYLRQAATGGQ